MFLLMMECFLGFANRNAAEMSILVPKSNPPANAETKKPRVQSLGLEDPLVHLGSTAARLKLKGIDGSPHKQWL